MPHFQYQQGQGPNVPPHGQSGIPTQFTNAYSFNSNAQGTNPSLASNGVSNTSFPNYVSTQHNSFLPPPFPPIPIPPYGTFSQPSPLAHDAVANMGSAQSRASLPQKPPLPSSIPITRFDPNSETPPNVVAAASDLEDGELSDGESSRHTKESSSGYKSPPRPPVRQINEDRQHSTRNHNSNANRGYRSPNGNFSRYSSRNQERPNHYGRTRGNFPPAGSSESSNQVVDSRGNGRDTQARWIGGDAMANSEPSSGARYPPIFPGEIQERQTAEEARRQHPLSHESRSENDVRINATTFTNEKNGLRDGYPFSEIEVTRHIRDRAKSALQELYPHQIGYAKLVQEGLDSGLLLELYNEMGISVSSPVLTRKVNTAESQGLAKVAFKAVVPGDSLNDPDRQQLSRADFSNTPSVSYISQNVNTQKPGMSTGHDLTVKRKRHEQRSEGDANGQPVQGSQTSKAYPSISSPKSEANLSPALPEKVNLPNEASSNNTKTKNSPPVVATKDTKVDTTVLSVSAGPLPKSATANTVVAKPADKALERKDYIARMLAAKAGKPMPASNAPTPSTTLAVRESEETTQRPPAVDLPSAGTPEERRLYLGNLAFSTTEDDVKALFDGYVM